MSDELNYSISFAADGTDLEQPLNKDEIIVAKFDVTLNGAPLTKEQAESKVIRFYEYNEDETTFNINTPSTVFAPTMTDEDGDDTTDEPDAGDDTDDGDMEPDDLGDDGGDSDDPDAGGDDSDMEPDDLGDDGGDGGEGGDDTPDAGDSSDGGDSGDTSGSSDGGAEGDIKGLENEIFEDLTDEQKAIRTKELKDRFIELYNVTLAFKEKVDYVKKNSDNMKIITKVSKSLDKLSDMISYYITKTFNTKSYIENKADFYYCLWVLDRLNELMGTLAPKEPIKK